MARVELEARVLRDFERFLEGLADIDADNASEQIEEIIEALQILTHSPLIGRPAKDGNRELVVGKSTRGCVSLYRYVEAIDTVFVLAMRSQREVGYRR